MMTSPIVERIARDAGIPGLAEVLAEKLEPTDLQSLLMAVYQERASKVTPATLLRQYQQNRFVQPAALDPRQSHRLDGVAYECLPEGFEPIELSPLCPLGTNSAIATVDQNKAITTIRNTEVVSDSTNVMALECASRRQTLYKARSASFPDTKLFAGHRLVRAQAFSGPLSLAHFRILSLVSAGRDRGGLRFETNALGEHIEFYVRVVQTLAQANRTRVQIRVGVKVFDETKREGLGKHLLEPLANKYSDVAFQFDDARESGGGYYVTAGFQLFVKNETGTEYFVADGGCTDWMQKLLSNHKERFIISGAGCERLLLITAPHNPTA
jgi:hypothetical protein